MHVDVAFQFGLLVFVELLFAKGTGDALRLERLVVFLPEMGAQNHAALIRFSANLENGNRRGKSDSKGKMGFEEENGI